MRKILAGTLLLIWDAVQAVARVGIAREDFDAPTDIHIGIDVGEECVTLGDASGHVDYVDIEGNVIE